MSRVCVNSPNLFCYICGEFTPKLKENPLSDLIKQCDLAYFDRDVKNQDKTWVPKVFLSKVLYEFERLVGTMKEFKKCHLLRRWYGLNQQIMPWIVTSV